jgi:hypothetical protein
MLGKSPSLAAVAILKLAFNLTGRGNPKQMTSAWSRRFGGAQDIIGESIALDSRDYTVIGV